MGLKFDGLEEFRASFERLRTRSGEVADQVVRDHMEHEVFPETQVRVPVMVGRLKATGRVERGDVPHEYAVWYGDSAENNDRLVDYAAAVHNRDATHAPPTGIDFVRIPLEGSADRLAQKSADVLEKLAEG